MADTRLGSFWTSQLRARSSHKQEHTKDSIDSVACSNKFSALEIEEPYDYFRLLDLPREIRDEIFDCMTMMRDITSNGQEVYHQVTTDLRADSIMFEGSGSRVSRIHSRCRPARGTLAMALVSKQVHQELKSAIRRSMPHHIYSEYVGDGADTTLSTRAIARFPTNVRRLYIQNCTPYPSYHYCRLNKESCRAQLRSGADITPFFDFLRACKVTTELMIDWCEGHRKEHLNRVVEVDEIYEETIQVVESMPKLQLYGIRSCERATYSSRSAGKAWDDSRMIEDREDLDGDFPHRRFDTASFLDGLGVGRRPWSRNRW